jgi:hypothetical protein
MIPKESDGERVVIAEPVQPGQPKVVLRPKTQSNLPPVPATGAAATSQPPAGTAKPAAPATATRPPPVPSAQAKPTPAGTASLPPEVVAARALAEKPKPKDVSGPTIFGENLISEKSLDEVILGYLAGNEDEGK